MLISCIHKISQIKKKIHLRYELTHFYQNVPQDDELKSLTTISKLRIGENRKVNKLSSCISPFCLILSLPVSTASSERAISAMKIVKSWLRNRMGDDFLVDNMVIYIEKKIAEKFSIDSGINDF